MYIFIALFAWWAFSVAIVFRKGVFVERLRNEMPVLFMLPRCLSVNILIFAMLIIAPYVMREPFLLIWNTWMNWKLKRIAKRIRKMSNGKDPELNKKLKDVADGLDEISKT